MIKEDKKTMKSAYIEQILMWLVIFTGFVWIFFFIINYATAIRIKDNMDALSKFAARSVSNTINQGLVPTNDLITNLNSIRISAIDPIVLGDIACVIATATPASINYQTIFIVQGTYDKHFLAGSGTNNFVSTKVVYNETNPEQIRCTLSISID